MSLCVVASEICILQSYDSLLDEYEYTSGLSITYFISSWLITLVFYCLNSAFEHRKTGRNQIIKCFNNKFNHHCTILPVQAKKLQFGSCSRSSHQYVLYYVDQDFPKSIDHHGGVRGAVYMGVA